MRRIVYILSLLLIGAVSCNTPSGVDATVKKLPVVFVSSDGNASAVWNNQYEALSSDPQLDFHFVDITSEDNLVAALDSIEAPAVIVSRGPSTQICRDYIVGQPLKVQAFCDMDGVYPHMPNLESSYYDSDRFINVPSLVFCSPDRWMDQDIKKVFQQLFSNMEFAYTSSQDTLNAKLANLIAVAKTRTVDTIQVNGVCIWYEEMGEGKPVILIHGNGGCHEHLLTAAGQLVRAGYKIYALDSRGQGANPPLSEYHYADMAEDVVEFCRIKGIEKPAVYGWSDGGIVALEAEVLHPGFSSLIAASGANVFSGKDLNVEFPGSFNYEHTDDPLVVMMVEEPNMTKEQLNSIQCPVLVLAGSMDIIPVPHTQMIAQEIPQGKLLVLYGETHGSYILRNPRLGEILLNYLSEQGY